MKCEEITDKIISVFYEVYNKLGYGFLEKVYVNAICEEMKIRGIEFINEFSVNVIYKGKVVGEYVADFVIGGVIIEVKAIRELSEADERQLLNYLRCTDKEVGLLFNFGEKAEIKRKVYDNSMKEKY